jgi:hypothetical protein
MGVVSQDFLATHVEDFGRPMTMIASIPKNSPEIESLWRSIWTAGSRHHVPTLLGSRRRQGRLNQAPLSRLPLERTGSIKLLRQDPWGIVAIELYDLELTGFDCVAGGNLVAPVDGTSLSGIVMFPSLRLCGKYLVKTGGAESAAARTMVGAVAGKFSAMASAGANLMPQAQLQQGLTNAKSYRASLAATSNGRQMVGAYYDNNDTFNTIMQQSNMSYLWVNANPNGGNDPTTGQPYTTPFFAGQTVGSTQSGATQPINGTPDATGNSPYNMHSFYQATQVMATAKFLQKKASQSGDTATAAAMAKAATATSEFMGNVKGAPGSPGPSYQSQTAQSVMGLVSTGAAATPRLNAVVDPLSAIVSDGDPDWLRQTVSMAIADHAELTEKGTYKGAAVNLDREHSEGGEFSTLFPAFQATLHGSRSVDGNPLRVRFNSVEAAVPEPRPDLGGTRSELLEAVQQALDKAAFLRAILQRHARSALQSSGLVQQINAAFHFAAKEGGDR